MALIWEGVVTKSGMEKWTDEKAKKSGETYRFSVENCNLILDKTLQPEEMPPVGQYVRAMVNRIYSAEKKREYWWLIGFAPMTPQVPQVNGQASMDALFVPATAVMH